LKVFIFTIPFDCSFISFTNNCIFDNQMTENSQIIGVDLLSVMIKIAKENINRRIKHDEYQLRIELHHEL